MLLPDRVAVLAVGVLRVVRAARADCTDERLQPVERRCVCPARRMTVGLVLLDCFAAGLGFRSGGRRREPADLGLGLGIQAKAEWHECVLHHRRTLGTVRQSVNPRTWNDESANPRTYEPPAPAYGPATTTAAFDGSSTARAAAWTSSRVTRPSRSGILASKSMPRPKNSTICRKFAMPTLVSSRRGIEPIRYCRDSATSWSVGPSAAILSISSSIDASARSTFAGFTPAQIISGPGTTLASSALMTK